MIALLLQALVIGTLCAGLGWLLSIANRRWHGQENTLIDTIEAELPQTQCGQCEYPGCRAYASAVAGGEAIDLCPPGGEPTVQALARLLNRPANPRHASRDPAKQQIAKIIEADCVGCALCIPACPVDAIIGAQGYLHGVLEDLCTGCELCIEACPVDCIDMLDAPQQMLSTKTFNKQASAEPRGCIRCGLCDQACPKGISVRELWWSIRQGANEPVPGPQADACIACGLCDASCPSGISLAGPILEEAERERTKDEMQKRANRAAELFQYAGERREQAQLTTDQRRAERMRRRKSTEP